MDEFFLSFGVGGGCEVYGGTKQKELKDVKAVTGLKIPRVGETNSQKVVKNFFFEEGEEF